MFIKITSKYNKNSWVVYNNNGNRILTSPSDNFWPYQMIMQNIDRWNDTYHFVTELTQDELDLLKLELL